jgi:formylglycine-generating enzyme required for sulfatase activity
MIPRKFPQRPLYFLSEIWFYLGEGDESKEPIIFKHDRFHLRDDGYAASAVTRVTWYGASAYARHYGKRLLTEAEWEYVASKHLIPGKQALGKKANNFQPLTTRHRPATKCTRI